MLKNHDLKTAVIAGYEYSFFYTREKNDINGNPRYRVFIIDPDGPAVYETILKCYECHIPERVATFIDSTLGIKLPF